MIKNKKSAVEIIAFQKTIDNQLNKLFKETVIFEISTPFNIVIEMNLTDYNYNVYKYDLINSKYDVGVV